ncbi:hypothetical protein FRC03_001796 [Tulasnella sp. 419]|nr:hypothetical protein FRC03_001796 [Tulasnella sp. 419]
MVGPVSSSGDPRRATHGVYLKHLNATGSRYSDTSSHRSSMTAGKVWMWTINGLIACERRRNTLGFKFCLAFYPELAAASPSPSFVTALRSPIEFSTVVDESSLFAKGSER